MTTKEFEVYLKEIGGLVNGFSKPDNKILIYDRGFFTVGDGWLSLIINLIIDLIDAGWNKELCQCKEKFGGLRFYTNAVSKECHDIISKYERLSYETCENCGKLGELHESKGWLKTLCNECKNK